MLPEDVTKEVRDRPLLNTTQRVVEYLQGELPRYNDKHLSTIADTQGMKDLEGGPKNAVNALVQAEQRMVDLYAKMENCVSAFSAGRASSPSRGAATGAQSPGSDVSKNGLRRPSPGFKGCWHCGKTNHKGGRKQCPLFK